ncbi:MAG: hypothetical protein SFU56_21830 [Capsulimonadales bacterium]|nr:hypothetical protein [Capsulimonadales bacterium]
MNRTPSRPVNMTQGKETLPRHSTGGIAPFLALLTPEAQDVAIGRAFTTPIRFDGNFDVEAERLIRDIAAGLTATAAELEITAPQHVRTVEEIVTAIAQNRSLAHDFAHRIVAHRWYAGLIQGFDQGAWNE